MSQHSEKKTVINGAQCFPALYLNESSIGAFPSPLLFPHSCGSRPPRLQARAPGRQAGTSADPGCCWAGGEDCGEGRGWEERAGRFSLARVRACGSGSPWRGSKSNLSLKVGGVLVFGQTGGLGRSFLQSQDGSMMRLRPNSAGRG